jgi:hypothetical protein
VSGLVTDSTGAIRGVLELPHGCACRPPIGHNGIVSPDVFCDDLVDTIEVYPIAVAFGEEAQCFSYGGIALRYEGHLWDFISRFVPFDSSVLTSDHD